MSNHLWVRLRGYRSLGWFIGVATLLTCFAFPLARRSIILSDEGFLLLQSLDMLDGKVLYRDLVTIVTPGVWFLVAGLFSLIEPSVFASRMLGLAGYLVLVGISYRIVAALTSRRQGLVAILLLMIFTVWAFPVWMLAWYSPFAVLFALGGLERLGAWRQSQQRWDLLWSGSLFGLSIACKQNYGVLAALGGVAGVLCLRLEARAPWRTTARGFARDALCLAGGGLLVAVPLVAYFARVGALGDFVDSTFLRTFEFASTSDIPFLPLAALWDLSYWQDGITRLIYLAVPMLEVGLPVESDLILRLHVLLYWIPIATFLFAAALACAPLLRGAPLDGGLACVVVVCGLVFLGVFPRADFNHLINVYQPVLVTGAVVAHRLRASGGLRRKLQLGAALTFAGIYGGIASYWYVALLGRMDQALAMPRGGVLIDPPLAARIEYALGRIRDLTREGEPVLTVPDLAMFNFLIGRPQPGPYAELYEHMIAHDAGASVVAAAEAAHVRLVVARYDNFFSHRVGLRKYAPLLTRYLRTHFRELDPANDSGFLYLVRREVPLPDVERVDVLADCDVAAKSEGSRQIRAHLLFDTLYHRFPDAEERSAPVETRCVVKVPDRAELAAQLAYPELERAQEDAALRADVLVEADGETRRLSRELIRLLPQARDGQNVRELRVDLSAYAGREVVITFRTGRRGVVRSRPSLHMLRLALEWRDPHIEIQPLPR